MSSPVDKNVLKDFMPINSLSPDHLSELARKTNLESVPTGRYLFKKGDLDKKHVYLISGEIELLHDKELIKNISAGTPEALRPLAHAQPRNLSARAKKDVTYVSVDSNLLDIMLTWDQTGTYHVEEIEENDEQGEDDWMTQLLQTKAFHRVPPANIQAIFMRMETVNYKTGDKVVSQGEEGDYFYIIKNGRAMVTRASLTNPKGMKLADLGPGDSFGEEALISEAKRNATVTMLSNGALVRLSKKDFINLLNEPMLDWVDYVQAKNLQQTEQACFLDVRLPTEHKECRIQGSLNIPLITLRVKMKSLDAQQKYIVYCDTGRRSSAAAYLLNEQGLSTYALKNGLNSAAEADKESD